MAFCHELSGVAAVGEDVAQRRNELVDALEDLGASVVVLDRRCGDHHHEQEPERVGDDVALSPLHFLALVIAGVSAPTVSAPRSDCESTMPALGVTLRVPPAFFFDLVRTSSRNASCTTSTVPSSRQEAK